MTITASSPILIPESLIRAAVSVLNSAQPADKLAAAAAAERQLSEQNAFRSGISPQTPAPPDFPARPSLPVLAPPGDMPKRKLGSAQGRAILLHAIAHIEFNAIDMAFDMAARFTPAIAQMGQNAAEFAADWIRIGAEEARHFALIGVRLEALGAQYGDYPAHNGLWEAAENTRGDVLSRLAVAPLILEARGLDVTPDMIVRLRNAGDQQSAAALEVIYREEVGHVACGKRWFDAICAVRGLDCAATFETLRKTCFGGELKPPFNHEAREKAGLARAFYAPKGADSRH